MTTSRRLADRKIAKFQRNITRSGAVAETAKKGKDYPVGPIVLGFFVFVVIGSYNKNGDEWRICMKSKRRQYPVNPEAEKSLVFKRYVKAKMS